MPGCAVRIKTEVLMKKLLCLLLGSIMLLSMFSFAGCAKKEETEADVATNTGAKTITLRLITEKKVCNTDEELAEYLTNECGGDKESQKYKDMLDTMKAYEAVEEEIAKITKSDFKTDVEILFYTEKEYYSKLEESMKEYALEQKNAALAQRALKKYIKEYKASATEEYPESAITASFYKYFPEYERYKDFASGSSSSDDVYKENDLGIKELVYPEADENQLDVVYISGYDMYRRYIDNDWITPLNSLISTTGKKLTYNISETLLNGVKVNGETYAIPNNVQIGEYTYMLVDRELAEKYKHTYESFNNIVDCNVFVNDVVKNHADVLPIDATFKECMDLFVWYWNIDIGQDEFGATEYQINTQNNFSILGKFYSDPSKVGRGNIELGFTSLLADKEYRDTLLCLKKYEYDGCYRAENDTRTDAAISFKTGTYSMMRDAFYNKDGTKKTEYDADYGVYTDENGKEYYLYVAKYPKADENSLYGNMFAVSANSKNPQACLEFITLLNTDATVRNLLQYGIKQGEHQDGQTPNYTVDEETGILKRLNNLYMMDIEKTGNCFIAYPEEGLPADYWENAKAQNNDALIDPLAGFDFNERLAEYGTQLDSKQLGYCAMLSEEVSKLINDPGITYDILKTRLEGEYAEKYSQKTITHSYTGAGGDKIEIIFRLDKLTNNNYDVSTGLGTADSPEMDPDGESPYTVYYKWLTTYKYLPAEN